MTNTNRIGGRGINWILIPVFFSISNSFSTFDDSISDEKNDRGSSTCDFFDTLIRPSRVIRVIIRTAVFIRIN